MSDIDFLLKSLELKDETRTGWEVRSIEQPESAAAHSWGVALLSFLLADDAGVDRQRAVEMALLHDIHESVSGDIMSGDLAEEEQKEKEEREKEGFSRLLELADGDLADITDLWREYEERETDTARFVKDMDLLETALQALYYHSNERYGNEETFFQEWDGMEDFFEGTRETLQTDIAKTFFDDLTERYEAAKT